MLTLQAGAMRCEIDPRLGGCVTALTWQDVPVLRPKPVAGLRTAREAGAYALVPFSNRIGGATLVWQGTQHPLVRNNGDEPHAIHGVGWQREWSVLDQDVSTVLLAYEHRPDAGWPFAFDASQTFRLRPDGLVLVLALTNQSSHPAPAGLGWHPYFVKRPGAHLRFEATGRWDMGEDKLPTVRRPATGLDTDCAALAVDHCFDGWRRVAELRDDTLRVRLESSADRLVVYTHPSRDFVAIEPVSHVNNALQLHAAGHAADELGLVTLAPGETLVMTIGLSVSAA